MSGARGESRAMDEAAVALDAPNLETLYRRYAVWLARALNRRFGQTLGDSVEDLVQEAYLRIAPGGGVGEVRHPRALLLKISINLAHDRIRHTTRARSAEALIEATAEKADTWSLPDQDAALILKQAVLALPEPLRDAFMLSRFAGYSNAEVAERLGIAVKTVEWRLTRALAALAERMGD